MRNQRYDALKSIGHCIREVRKRYRPSQEEMAEGSRITPNHPSAIEPDKTNVTATLYLNLASFYNANIGSLFHGTGNALLPGSNMPGPGSTPNEQIALCGTLRTGLCSRAGQ